MKDLYKGIQFIHKTEREKTPHLKVGVVTATSDTTSSDISIDGRSNPFTGVGPILGIGDGVNTNESATILHGKMPQVLGTAPFNA